MINSTVRFTGKYFEFKDDNEIFLNDLIFTRALLMDCLNNYVLGGYSKDKINVDIINVSKKIKELEELNKNN
jgi:hypothetical protein